MHKHHIVPLHRDPNSTVTVEVSVTCHAMFHFCEWQLYQNKYDWLAWRGLAGLIGKEEISEEIKKQAIAKRVATAKLHGPYENQVKAAKRNQPLAVIASMTPEARANQKEAFRRNKHAQGERNSQWGTMWITDGVNNKKIKKDSPIPEGYRKGRIL